MTQGFQFSSEEKCPEANSRVGRERCSPQGALVWLAGKALQYFDVMVTWWPTEMQEGSHDYKAFTIIYDPSFQYLKGKEIFHGEGNTHTVRSKNLAGVKGRAGAATEGGPTGEQ